MDMDKPMRLSVRVSARTNDWLDKRSEEMAISKTALVAIAVENYIKETEVVHGLPKILEKLQELGIDV